MNYEKKYKEALLKAKDMLSYKEVRSEDIEYLFPELKDNDDEKIREWLLNFVQGLPDEGLDFKFYNLSKEQVIVWLEKQRKSIQNEIEEEDIKEQLISYFRSESRDVPHRKEIHDKWISWIEKQGDKPQSNPAPDVTNEAPVASKSKPTFKVGDWIVINGLKNPLLIKNLVGGYCSFEDIKGNVYYFCLPPSENEDHLWTLQDAKEGDVLSDNGEPFIFKGLDPQHSNSPIAYCGIDCENQFMVSNGEYWWTSYEGVTPATREECDFLFKEMEKSGYKWDSNKKRLIQQNSEKENDED